MSNMRQQQQWSAKNIFCKQKSIDDKTPQYSNDSSIVNGGISGGSSGSKKILRKQLSVDHVTSNLKHNNTTSSSSSSIVFGNLLWSNSQSTVNFTTSNLEQQQQTQQFFGGEPNLKITSAIKKRAQQDLLSSCLSKSIMKAASTTAGSEVIKAKDKINIKLFLSHDIGEDASDNEHGGNANSGNKPSSTASTVSVNAKASTETSSGKLSVSARRAQFQASRRIMSAPIRPLNQLEDAKNKRKPRKKKVIRLNLTLNRDESPDEYAEEVEDIKPIQPPPQKSSTKKAPPLRSRSVLGCDQIGIETLVSMINGESDSEKEDGPMQQQQQPVPPVIKNEPPPQRIRANMLRKTVSFQEDDSQLQAVAAATGKDAFNNFRRAPVVPFAGRMRNTRSLFGQEICNLYMNNNNNTNNNNSCDKKIDDKNENDLNSSNHQEHDEIKEKPKLKKYESFDEKKSQDILTQPREEECWRLYEKMKKTGLNVSYDTILRGILKPSELRLLEKQKKLLGNIDEKSLDVVGEKHEE